MFGKRFRLFNLLGFTVSIDLSWIFLAVLITWSLAVGVFPSYVPNLQTTTYWLMGALGALGLFLSIVLHELSHSLVAQHSGLPMKGITLFIFGGVAEMDGEPANPRVELLMALAGPAASLAISAVLFGFSKLGQGLAWPAEVSAVLGYLAVINLVLAAFNLVPAFPLDGGRVLRAALWRWKGDISWATRLAAKIGSGFGAGLIFLGLISVLSGQFVGGIWWFLIGLFLRGAAQGSYQQLLIRQTFAGEPVRRFMQNDPVMVPRSTAVGDFVENYVYRYHHKMFPVVDHGHLLGCVSTREVKELPRDEWYRQTAGSIAAPCNGDNAIGPDDDAMKALSIMSRYHTSRLMVVEGDRVVGVIALKDLLGLLSLKLELEPS